MDGDAREALAIIRDCVGKGRYHVLPHFVQRMDLRGLVWPDVLTVIDGRTSVRSDGRDRWKRPKWIVSGMAPDGLALDIVCVLDVDERGDLTVFITAY